MPTDHDIRACFMRHERIAAEARAKKPDRRDITNTAEKLRDWMYASILKTKSKGMTLSGFCYGSNVFRKMPEATQQLLLDSLVKSGAVIAVIVQKTRYVAARYVKRDLRAAALRLVQDASIQIVGSTFEDRCAAVLRVIKKGDTKDKAYSVRELSQQLRTFAAMKPNERKDVIENLKSNGDVFEFVRTPVRGPKTMVYMSRALAVDDMTGGDLQGNTLRVSL